LIDDFNDGDLSSWTLATTSNSGDQEWTTFPDPNDSQDLGLFVESGDIGTTTNWSATAASIELPTPLGPGMVGTLYLRSLKFDDGFTNNLHVTLSEQATFPGNWGSYSAAFKTFDENDRFSGSNVATWLFAEGDMLTRNQWYEYWLVMDWDAGAWELYLQRPGETVPQQVLFNNGDDTFTTMMNSRKTPEIPLTMLHFVTVTNVNGITTGGLYILDDVYWDTTENLTNPVSGTIDEYWGGYLVETDGTSKWIQTGDWMGTLEVTHEPWLYSYKLNHWVWMPEPADDATGAWVYVRK